MKQHRTEAEEKALQDKAFDLAMQIKNMPLEDRGDFIGIVSYYLRMYGDTKEVSRLGLWLSRAAYEYNKG